MTKSALRTQAIAKRNALSKAEYWHLNDEILERLKTFDWGGYRCVHLFLPIKEQREIDTFEILSYFKTAYPFLNIVVPKTRFKDYSLSHIYYDYEHTILVKNKQGIPEPLHGKPASIKDIDAVLVPLLGFDNAGHRLGYGGGFYDRFLCQCRPETLKIGLSFFPPEKELFVPHKYDVKLTHCVTPSTIYTF